MNAYAEVRRNDTWQLVKDPIFPAERDNAPPVSHPFDTGKNYRLFGFLSNVRNEDNVPCLAEYRPAPDDLSAALRHLCYDDLFSWVTLAEILAFNYGTLVIDKGQTVTMRKYLGEWFFEQVGHLATLGAPPEDVRVIMTFSF